MKIVYSAPNRAHHYGYARQLHRAGILKTFVSGFPRISRRAPIPEIGKTLKRVDQLQTLYVISQKFRLPRRVSDELAHRAKIQIDRGSRKVLKGADMFLFYNGCGLESARWLRRRGGLTIVEAVNSHVLVQEELMREEHKRLNLPWRRFHIAETRRRVKEVEEADYVLVPSTFVARSFAAKGIPAGRLLRVPYPMQSIAGTSGTVAKSQGSGQAFRVLYVGSISVRKGLRYLIEAFRHLKHPHKELWLVGPAASPTGLENLLIPEGVKFCGPLKGDALRESYANATVFVLPSIEEGLALVLSEAMSFGLPVIATENTGLEDLLDEGKGGMIVPIRDSEALAVLLNRLAEDADFLKAKRTESTKAAARLGSVSEITPDLTTALVSAFRQHHPESSNESH